jgi:hypothetical protein
MFSFAAMRALQGNFKQLLAAIVLGIFSLAITPWSALHHHEKIVEVKEKNCTHTGHVNNSADNCLICKAHFEKNFTSNFHRYTVYLKGEVIKRTAPIVSASFTKIVATCLRGPPYEM